MTTAEDKTKVLKLINELPFHDGSLPINDVVENGVIVKKGAHGAVYNEEAAIAGMIKAYAISSRLREIAANDGTEGFDSSKAFNEIVSIAASMDGGRKPNEVDLPQKIGELDLSDPAKTLLKRIAETGPNDISSLVAEIKTILPELKQGEASEVFDVEVKAAAQAKVYQITDTNLYNQSTVRLGYVPDASNSDENGLSPMRPTHLGGQQAAERHSDDAGQKQRGVATFLKNFAKARKADDKSVFSGDENQVVHVFDVAYGDGKTAVAALKALTESNPSVQIHYTGIDVLGSKAEEQAKKAFEEAGLTNVTSEFVTGTFGLKEKDKFFKENDDKLTPYLGKQDLILASHVYNFDTPSFMKQIEKLQKPDGIAYIAHESQDSWIGAIRDEHKDLLRPPVKRVEEIDSYLTGNGRTGDVAAFSVPTTDSVAPLTLEEMSIFKGMKQGEYYADRTQDMTAEQRASFLAKRDVIESYMRAPMESFSEENRTKLLNAFQAKLEEAAQGKLLIRNSATQVVLSPGREESLYAAVKQAVEATANQLNPTKWRDRAGKSDFQISS